MIKSEDFRRGNYVNDHKGIPYKIKTISETLGFYRKWVNGCFIENIYPIPLTEEILLECEFSYGVDKWFNTFYYTDNKEYTELFAISFNLFSNRLSIYEIDMEDTCIFTRKKVQYLHQLQNLYYALTNEELNVEL